MKLNPKIMRARFAELRAERDRIAGAAAPLRAKRDTMVNKAREAEAAINAKIKEAETGLFDIDQEIAMISRALRGQTGEAAE